MNRRQFVALALAACPSPMLAAPEPFTRGLLWRVTQKGAVRGYVYGTIHDADSRLAALPLPVTAALERSRSLLLEFLPDAGSRERFLEAALFDNGQTLEQAIGAEDFERALETMKPIGLPRDFVNQLKPWAVLINLRSARGADAEPIDTQLLERARARHIPLYQIEGVEEQIFTFDEFPMASQVALLKHSLAHREELLELAAHTVEAYLAADLAAIWQLRREFAARHPEIAAHQSAFEKRVVRDRSVVMAYRMQRRLREGKAFVALGALHLYGRQGVLALLGEDGYRASRVS